MRVQCGAMDNFLHDAPEVELHVAHDKMHASGIPNNRTIASEQAPLILASTFVCRQNELPVHTHEGLNLNQNLRIQRSKNLRRSQNVRLQESKHQRPAHTHERLSRVAPRNSRIQLLAQ